MAVIEQIRILRSKYGLILTLLVFRYARKGQRKGSHARIVFEKGSKIVQIGAPNLLSGIH